MRIGLYTWQRAVIVCALGMLSACSVLPEAPVRDSYRLPISSFPAPASQPVPVDWSLRVATPHSGQWLDSRRMLVIRQDNQINVYKGAQWSDPPPVLARDRILDAFRADGRVPFVSNEAGSLKADLALHSDLRNFHVEYQENRPFVRLQLDASLVATASRNAIATRSFSITLPTKGEQVPDIVEAFGAATDRLSQEVVEWTMLQAKSGANRLSATPS